MVAPLTVQSVLAELAEGPVPAERILALRELVLEARRETERDLEEQEPCEELASHLTALVEDCQLLTAILRPLAEACAADDTPRIHKLAADLKDADAQLASTEEALQEWENRVELRCPACGEPGDVCARHELDGLYPDPTWEPPAGSAELGDNYLVAFAAYQGVLEGAATLGYLEEALTPLEVMLRRFITLASGEHGLHGDTTADALTRIVWASQQSLDGLKRMRRVLETRQTRDLNAGWAEVFSHATEIQECVPIVARAFGGAAKAALAGVGATRESVDIDFD